ncbi:MAG: hypothetical protein MHPSP_004546, partial [Paramarteilia canceri]
MVDQVVAELPTELVSEGDTNDGKVRKAKGRSEQWLAKQLKIQKQKHSTSTSNKTDQDTDKFIFEQAEKNADSAGSDFYHKP